MITKQKRVNTKKDSIIIEYLVKKPEIEKVFISINFRDIYHNSLPQKLKNFYIQI